MDNKISIIVPVYNGEKYLNTCLNSLSNQTYRNIEIICVNDGSTDNSKKILKEFKNKDSRFKIINQKNAGVSSARNKGNEYVTGKFIMYLDSDDWIDPEACQVALNELLASKADVILWTYTREFGERSAPKYIFEEKRVVFKENNMDKLRQRFFGLVGNELQHPENADSVVPVWGKLYKSSLILNNNIKFIDTKIVGTSEDALFNIEVFRHVKKAIYIEKFFNHYRKTNETSFTTGYKKELPNQWNQLFTIMANYIKDENLNKTYTEALNNRIVLSIIGLGLNEVKSNNKISLKFKNIKSIISSPKYKKAIEGFNLNYLPFHWKVFFFATKHKITFVVYFMLMSINKLK